MKNIVTYLLLASALVLSACDTDKVEVLKSPCASLDGGPCGPKRVPLGNQQA